MHCSRRHHHALPRSEAQRAAVGQLDLQPTLHHEKQLIGVRMLVPGILPGENPRRQHGVHLAEDLVPVLLGDRSRFRGDIHHHERRVAHRLAGIVLSGGY
jgi:hypothetical protein